MRQAIARALEESNVYAAHVFALFWPGSRVRSFRIHPGGTGPPQGWDDDELLLLVDEGRRQLDRQRADLDRIQTRSQFLFTTAIGLLALLVSQLNSVNGEGIQFAVWYLGLALVVLGLLGAAALMSVRSTFGLVDTQLLSQQAPPILPELARAYAESVAEGHNTVGTRLTVFRDAVLLIIIGAVLQFFIWLSTM